jgi:hypothetical protein
MGSSRRVYSQLSRAEKLNFAAAYSINERVIGSWSALVPRTPRVLVPIHLDALVVRAGGGEWADCAMTVPAARRAGEAAIDSRLLQAKPFQDRAIPRGPGVYLHWALPDALTQGTGGNTGVDFPVIPDRWLVVRLQPGTLVDSRRTFRAWVLRAADEHPQPVDLNAWVETGSAGAGKLTALGHGDAAWAAYYDNVENRLAFHDDLRDIRSGPLAYLVCGWYADPNDDPLGSRKVKSLADFYARMNALKWKLESHELEQAQRKSQSYLHAAVSLGLPTIEAISIGGPGASPAALDDNGHPEGGVYVTDGSWWPSLTMYHGLAVGIGWPGPGWPGRPDGLVSDDVGGPPSTQEVRVMVGNTPSEALADLVAQSNHAPAERNMLEAFLTGALADLDRPGGQARVDARLHAASFGSLPGGETIETATDPGVPVPPTLPAKPVVTGPSVFPRTPHGGKSFATAFKDAATSTAAVTAAPVAHAGAFSTVSKGALSAAIGAIASETPTPAATPPSEVDAPIALPRKYVPADPVLLVQGARRSYKHGKDGRFNPDGTLSCRLTGFCMTGVACSSITGEEIRPEFRGEELLERGIHNGSVPPECEELLREAVVADPGSSAAAAKSTGASGAAAVALANRFAVEQTVWWALRDPRADHAALVAKSGISGMLPSAVGISPPVRPWTPLHLDWRIQFVPSEAGYRDWSLGELDYIANALPALDDLEAGVVLQGRALLADGLASNVGRAVRNAMADAARAGGAAKLAPGKRDRYSSALAMETVRAYRAHTETAARVKQVVDARVDRSGLEDVASTLENMDLLSGAFEHFHTDLRGGFSGDGVAAATPDDPAPTPFFAVRAGFLRILRIRLVDCFGQFVDLDPARILVSTPMLTPGHAAIAALPPRFTSPTRLWLRLFDGAAGAKPAGKAVRPVAGFVLPDHLDGALEFFDSAGGSLGQLRADPDSGILWEEAPGRASTAGQDPVRALGNPFLSGMATSLVDWGIADPAGAEHALSALLRAIDSTLWSVDPYAHTGDEHLSLLVGHPIVVVRAKLLLEVTEPIAPTEIAKMAVPVRLGALSHWDDGLLGFFVNDDYRVFHVIDPAAAGMARKLGPGEGFAQDITRAPAYYSSFSADLPEGATAGSTPVVHPYVDGSGVLFVMPGQEVNLTMLLEPHSAMHATAGLVPRKEIALRREWTADALQKISPTFRFGPVLLDPKRIRMPVAGEAHGAWTWTHRLDVASWADDPVVNSAGDANLPQDPVVASEGWLKLTPTEEPKKDA